MRKKLPSAFYNTVTLTGLTIAGLALALIIFLYVLELTSGQENPYMGIITFVALPGVLLFGLLVAAIGVFRANRRKRRGIEGGELPVIDFNNPKHRRAFSVILFGGVILCALSGFGSYQAYEYTESVEFCGKVCHNVMKPEYTAYQASPHARVSCVQCHIGPGAEWYVKSKMSGAYQVYSVLFNKYHRPIETPIANLRPARETCEQCHWPSHFYSQKMADKNYFLSDEENSQHQMSMLMKIGGTEHGMSEGIHAHMYLDNEIFYVASDDKRQVIPYVESVDKDGKVTVYRSTESTLSDEQIKKMTKRVVDCIDCHNRPAHQYNHPARSMNLALSKGWIDKTLPESKRIGVEVLEKQWKTEAEAIAGIKKDIEAYYKETYPDLATSKSKEIQNLISQVTFIYKHNYFPEMKTDWRSFPDNLDHMHNSGCFRCHDNKHVSDTGKVISNDCQSCHTILSQQTAGGPRETNLKGLEFKHPVDIGDEWKNTPCKDCHGQQEE